MSPAEATKGSPLDAGAGAAAAALLHGRSAAATAGRVSRSIAELNERGFWLAPLGYTTHPYSGPAPETVGARRLLTDARRRRRRHVAVSRPDADGHLDRGLHPQHGRADPRAGRRRDDRSAHGVRGARRPWRAALRRRSVAAQLADGPTAALGAAGRVAPRQPRSASAATPSTVVGAAARRRDADGPAVEFDGVDDGLLVARQPARRARRASRSRSTSSRRPDGPEEQRFLHFAGGRDARTAR